MKLLPIIGLLLAAASAGIWSLRQRELNVLRADISQTRNLQAELANLRQALRKAPDDAVNPQELTRLRALRPELARLRGTIIELRQRAAQSPELLLTEAKTVQAEADKIRAWRLADETARNMAEQINAGISLLRFATKLADGSTPRNWTEVQTLIMNAPANTPNLPDLLGVLERANKKPGGLAQLEIVPNAQIAQPKSNGDWPHLGILRETTPRWLPDGGYARFYAWLDWKVEQVMLPDGNFAAWEAQHFPSTTANP
jgi:hypothetical protein